MNDTNKQMLLSHQGRKLLNVVPMLLVFSLGFVLGMTSNTKFPNVYLPFVPLLPSHTPPPPHLPPTSPPLPQPPPSPSPQNPQMALAGFLAPSSVMHNMTDEELFWRASMVPKVRRTPYHQVPKVSFLFLVRGDLPLRPLWEKFFAGNEGLYSIYVHVDPSYTSSPPKDSVFYGRMILSQKTMWGHVTLLEAERRLLANAFLDRSNERFVVLSESCIPVYDFATVYALLTGSNTSFVDSYFNRGRYNDFFARRCNISLAQWRKGSQWFEMDRDLAVEVVSDDTYFPEFREYCTDHEPCLMEEHYMATLPNQLGWTRNANRSLTYVDWRKGGFHPRRYGGKDVTEELIKEIRGGAGKNCTYNGRPGGICYVFARKFAPDTLDPLLALAPKVMGFGG
ncbi:glycosyltransferase BC10-like [Phragmites australis]|uniref:glycosyltransferase BC10-like n=1 Tax=Phragmites australis TaxID=29695 RepID=UPI002D766B98|nr:glycosyltransferase BC10-like [Phragmites australis]XP_062195975.1 glycosyltransferase BC10-like [Phragmites australis]XP_062196057.1 glycosyltransferase BC10-like [Phragmites australis]XP_062196131.1 glycosyltransferase BC10-like [Phragmites australis]